MTFFFLNDRVSNVGEKSSIENCMRLLELFHGGHFGCVRMFDMYVIENAINFYQVLIFVFIISKK